MWKKNEEETMSAPGNYPAPPSRTDSHAGGGATIGKTIVVRGDLEGDEDLIILGRLEGNVQLKEHSITVGQTGRVKADLRGGSIRVDGEVRGNLYGEKEVIIRASGRVQGNIVAPRVTLENGSKFKGAIDMEGAAAAKPTATAPAAKPETKPVQDSRTGNRPDGSGAPNRAGARV